MDGSGSHPRGDGSPAGVGDGVDAVGPMTRLELQLYMERIAACERRLRDAVARVGAAGDLLALGVDVHRDVHAVLLEHFARPFSVGLKYVEKS